MPRRRWTLVALIVVAAGFLGSYALARPGPQVSSKTKREDAIPAGAGQLVAKLAVLRRAQTASDRSFLSTLHQVALRYPAQAEGRLTNRFRGYVPSLTRLVETLPDGRHVFMLVQRPDSRTSRYTVGLVFLQPNDALGHGGLPIAGGDDDASSATLGDLRQPSCFGFTDHTVVSDAITRIRWSFARQDALGFVYRRPLTINVAVRNNAAIATVTARPPCESPNVATAYAPDGHVLASYGNPGNLNRIIRPIRHGRPWGP